MADLTTQELLNTQLKLQNLMIGEPSLESFQEALNSLDTLIRRGVPTERAEAITTLRGSLIAEGNKLAKIQKLKSELSQPQAPVSIGTSNVNLEQIPGAAPGRLESYALPAGEARPEVGRVITSAPWTGSPTPGGYFAKALVSEPAPANVPSAVPKRLAPSTLIDLYQAGMGGLASQLEPQGPKITSQMAEALAATGNPIGNKAYVGEVDPGALKKAITAQKEEMMALTPAPSGTYLNKNGNQDNTPGRTMADIINLKLRKLDTRQETILASAENWSVHNDMMLQYLDVLSKEGLRPITFLKSTIQRFNNNPKAEALFGQFEALTPFAASTVVAAGSAMRGGAMAAKMLTPSAIIQGNTLEQALEKLANNYELSIQRAKFVGANTEPYQLRRDMVNKMKRGEGYIKMIGFNPVFVRNE